MDAPDERNAGDGLSLEGEAAHVLGLEVVDVRLSAGPCQHLDLHRHRVQEVHDALGGRVDLEPGGELRILRRDPDWAQPRMALAACPGTYPQLLGVLDVKGGVAVERDHRGGGGVNRVRAEGEGFGRVHAGADAAGDHDLDVPVAAEVDERLPPLDDG